VLPIFWTSHFLAAAMQSMTEVCNSLVRSALECDCAATEEFRRFRDADGTLVSEYAPSSSRLQSILSLTLPVEQIGMNCRQSRSRRPGTQDEFAQLAQMFGFKRCPSCGQACEKQDEDDCDHMTCICGKEFCWSCLHDRTIILHHGCHYHAPDCRFFVPYNGPLEKKDKCPECCKNGRPCKPEDAAPLRASKTSPGKGKTKKICA